MRCAYEFQRFEKVAWSYVKTGSKLVFEVSNPNVSDCLNRSIGAFKEANSFEARCTLKKTHKLRRAKP